MLLSNQKLQQCALMLDLELVFRIMLIEMGHPQLLTPLEDDNTTAFGILTKQLIPKHSKAIHMRFFWLHNRTNQQ